MYFDAKFADWVRENGQCQETTKLKHEMEVFDWIMRDIYQAAVLGKMEVRTPCPEDCAYKIEEQLKDLGFCAEWNENYVMKVEW